MKLLASQISWNQPAVALHNWIRGHDKVPGAWALIDGQVSTVNYRCVDKNTNMSEEKKIGS